MPPGFSQNTLYDGNAADLPPDYTFGNFNILARGGVPGFTRERANMFDTSEANVSFRNFWTPPSTATYEIRDYYGDVVYPETDEIPETLVLPNPGPGAYRLFYRREEPMEGFEQWGRAMGGCCFVVWRVTPGMPRKFELGDSFGGNSEGGSNLLLGSMMGFGQDRLQIFDAANPEAGTGGYGTLSGVLSDIAVMQEWFLAYDPDRPKTLLVNFSNYTNAPGENAGVTAVVNATYPAVTHFEAKNEPDGMGAEDWLEIQAAFYATVKAAAPGAQVIGPCPTGLAGPTSSGVARFLRRFFEMGGASVIDKRSHHDYNSGWGDLVLYRLVYDRDEALMAEFGLDGIEKWMTEWGAGAADFGVFQPRMQGRMIMLALQVWEQYGITKERVKYFYPGAHGFYAVPTWFAQWEIGFFPAVALVRVWSEELLGKNFAQRYGFGRMAEPHTIGSRFEAEDGSSVAAFSSAGRTDDTLTCTVTAGVSSLTMVSPFGVESTLTVTDRQVAIPLDNGIPTYVRLPAGVNLYPVAARTGPNLALGATYTPAGSGAGASKVTDGVLRSWFFLQQGGYYDADGPGPFVDDDDTFPQSHVVDFGAPTEIDTVVVRCPPPYSFQGTLIDYDVQIWTGSAWSTVDTVTEPINTLLDAADQLLTASQVESYFPERSVFVHEFAPVTTTKIRLWVRDCTFGGFPDQDSSDARGENWPHVVQFRQIEVYNRSALPAPKYGARVA